MLELDETFKVTILEIKNVYILLQYVSIRGQTIGITN